MSQSAFPVFNGAAFRGPCCARLIPETEAPSFLQERLRTDATAAMAEVVNILQYVEVTLFHEERISACTKGIPDN